MFLGTNLYYYNKSEDNFAPPTVLSKIPGLNLMLINTLKTFSFDYCPPDIGSAFKEMAAQNFRYDC